MRPHRLTPLVLQVAFSIRSHHLLLDVISQTRLDELFVRGSRQTSRCSRMLRILANGRGQTRPRRRRQSRHAGADEGAESQVWVGSAVETLELDVVRTRINHAQQCLFILSPPARVRPGPATRLRPPPRIRRPYRVQQKTVHIVQDTTHEMSQHITQLPVHRGIPVHFAAGLVQALDAEMHVARGPSLSRPYLWQEARQQSMLPRHPLNNLLSDHERIGLPHHIVRMRGDNLKLSRGTLPVHVQHRLAARLERARHLPQHLRRDVKTRRLAVDRRLQPLLRHGVQQHKLRLKPHSQANSKNPPEALARPVQQRSRTPRVRRTRRAVQVNSRHGQPVAASGKLDRRARRW
mmetsp:Transcript_11903/g.33537  ORF Transcript_11903/g.33537 Transcript_11903/m.33537 type:complete len:349 (+) Transcript_11903:626-1672(+)